MNKERRDRRRYRRSDIPHPGVTPLSPSELLPLREADGPERESKTGYIQRLQIRGSTKNTATGSKRDAKRGEKRVLGGEEEWDKRLKMRF